MKNNSKLIIPPSLQKGDTIGFISPAAGLAPFAMHRVQNAIKYFESLGYIVKIAKNALKNEGYVSSSVENRLKDIHEMFADKKVKAIISTIGGNNSNQLLTKLDYKLISENPKIFVGYSDITSLHFAIQKKANLATYYGPCVMTQFGEYPSPLPFTVESFFKTVTDKSSQRYFQSKAWTDEILDWFNKIDLTRPRKKRKNTGYHWLKGGEATGPAWGGTLQTLNALVGTDFWIDPKKSVFFLDIPEGHDINSGMSLAEIDFYLNHLKLAGVFNSISALVVGRPYKYSTSDIDSLNKIILSVVENLNYPILTLANIGHTDPIITLQYGSVLHLDSKKDLFETL